MSGKPIDEAVSVTLHSDRAGCEWFIVTSKDHPDSESEVTPSDDPALFDLLKALTAAQQQGQAVACVACEDKPDPGNNPCGWCGRTTPQPTQQGGGEVDDEAADASVWTLIALMERVGGERDEGEDGTFLTMTLDQVYALESLLTARGHAPGWVDTAPTSAPVGVEWTDERIIAVCKAAGVRWIEADEEEGGFPGGFDITHMPEMRRLFTALAQQPAAVDGARDLIGALQVAELALRERGLQASGEYRQIEAALAKYAVQQPAASAVALTVCCGREECGGECGNEWRGMEWVRITQQPAAGAVDEVRLVPVEPTNEMVEEAAHLIYDMQQAGSVTAEIATAAYRTMLEAAPSSPEFGSESLTHFLERTAREIVERDTAPGSFAAGIAESLRGRALTLRTATQHQEPTT